MFGNSDFLLDVSFPSQEFGPTQDEGAAPRLTGEALQQGVVPLTVALCLNANLNHHAFQNGKCELYDCEFPFCEMQGMINSLTISNDQWEFVFSDGSGELPMIYQVRNDLGAAYEAELATIRPNAVNYTASDDAGGSSAGKENQSPSRIQAPCQVIGVPQILGGELSVVVAFLRATTTTECYACHPLNVVHEYLKWKMGSKTEESGHGVAVAGMAAAAAAESIVEDPFGSEEITIADADVADLVGSSRLNRVIWKLLSSAPDPSNGVLLEGVVSKCAKWAEKEVRAAIADLEDGGVLIYTTGDKSKVALI